ncbi:hypothetical protein [Ornithinimicrobium sp. INDO-MA30-4]|nr:hypothetical protein [Ornithinimicrobium sp. INDO-MA30-4]
MTDHNLPAEQNGVENLPAESNAALPERFEDPGLPPHSASRRCR